VLVPPNAGTADWPTIEVEELDLGARERIFASEVPGAGAAELALRFRVSIDEVRAAARAARTQDRLHGDGGAVPDLAPASVAREVLAQGSRRMGRMVTHLPSRARMQDLVVPASMQETLADVIGFFRARPRVAELGMKRSSTLGSGLSCLFSGGPGTGKTFAAQCLASELELNLYRIDLSQVVSKYIGETEKALQRVFEEAEAGHGILLFDEADALFGKRSEVKDAHDRYANVEVAFLLQRMESFDGISILTTNMRSHIDTAFLRRLRFVVEFPMPDAPARRRLWEASLPARHNWLPSLDLAPFVERFAFSGGNIHNVGLAAAHLCAAGPGSRLGPDHLARATYRELEKVGLGRCRDDFGPLWEHLPHAAAESPPPRTAELRARAANARRAAERGRA
jgi:hypothetical protein